MNRKNSHLVVGISRLDIIKTFNPWSGPPRTAFVHDVHRVSVLGASLGWSSLCFGCTGSREDILLRIIYFALSDVL